jgi:hypothetical protein
MMLAVGLTTMNDEPSIDALLDQSMPMFGRNMR